MANYDFRFLSVRPTGGWTSQSLSRSRPPVTTSVESVVGPVNAAAQNQVTAAQLRTTPSTLYDTSLGSRQYMNPNTGIRQPVAASSVYAQSDVPAFLAQSVDALNAEQALRRSLAAEWQNRLLRGVEEGGPNAYMLAEALRAASVGPGSSVAFGKEVADAKIGQGYLEQSQAAANLAGQKQSVLGQQQRDILNYQAALKKQAQTSRSNSGMFTYDLATGAGAGASPATLSAIQLRQPTATAIGGGSGWAPAAPRSSTGYW
jgi:hypothetical protein